MNFVKTQDVQGLAFSPWELRPGTSVNVAYSYVVEEDISWDSNAPIDISVSGMVWPTSIQSQWPIPASNLTIAQAGLFSDISISPLGKDVIDLKVFYKVNVQQNLDAISAISTSSAVYYDDWFLDEEGTPTPMTIVPLTLPINVQVYKPEDFTVTFDQEERGISVLGDDTWTSTSVGTLKMSAASDNFAMSRNLFRLGKTQVMVPLASSIPTLVRYEVVNGHKIAQWVEIDIQEWAPNRYDVRGILWHRDKLYVLTDLGMFSFDRWGEFDTPDGAYPNVIGYDLTYAVNDLFLVTDGPSIKVYNVRHDFLYLDRNVSTLYMREQNPVFLIGG